MEKFKLEGYYNFVNAPNGKGDLTGEFDVAEDGSFEGVILDAAHSRPNQFMKGHLLNDKGLAQLVFIKINDRSYCANIFYELSKTFDNSFEGKYIGEWGALHNKISFDRNLGLFLAQVDLSVVGIGDSTEITLYKK